MKLDNADILKFQKLYRDQFGIDLGADDLDDQAHALASLVKLVYRPMTQNNWDAIHNRKI